MNGLNDWACLEAGLNIASKACWLYWWQIETDRCTSLGWHACLQHACMHAICPLTSEWLLPAECTSRAELKAILKMCNSSAFDAYIYMHAWQQSIGRAWFDLICLILLVWALGSYMVHTSLLSAASRRSVASQLHIGWSCCCNKHVKQRR